jgi:formamidopyrimidine-DNA glycosylase
MPEINEVKRYADFLNHHLKNKTITDINILNGRYKKHGPFELYNELKKDAPFKVSDVKTKGKFLYFIINQGEYYLLSTLGLSGGWTFYNSKTKKYYHPTILEYIGKDDMDGYMATSLKHLNVEFKTKDGIIYFYDTLSFGTLKVIKSETELNKKLSIIGPDIMDQSTTFDLFKERLLKKINLHKEIGLVLMNQKLISGIGNYLRADILWLSKISPFRKVNKLDDNELHLIYHNAKVLTWGDYDKKQALKLKIITKKDKVPSDYKRDFFVYNEETDIYNNKVTREELYEGSQKRFIYWVKGYQT